MALPALDWPESLNSLLSDIRVVPGREGKSCLRLDQDVDAETITLLNYFEAQARHRQVRIWLPEGAGCLKGSMNTIIGLGTPVDPARHRARVRISFHNVSADDCSDEPS